MKKHPEVGSVNPFFLEKNTLRIMKMVLFALFVLCINLSATNDSYAQNTKIDLNLEHATLKQVFNEIESKSEFTFIYNINQIDVNRTVRINAKNKKVNEILDNILSDYDYVIEGKMIAIIPKSTEQTQQQKSTVSGVVSDDTGEPMIGVSVTIKGTTTGTVTDINGRYVLPVDNKAKDILVFSFVGYLKKEIPINNQSSVDAILIEDTKLLSEVIVVGYGTQKKANLTGAVGTINTAEALQSRPVTNVQELFAGTVPGLNIDKGSGAVGSGASLNIRGTSTIGNSSGVLVIIDGFPGNINTLNPNDIESVSILKDAASSAIYGSRAANGVILITTKTSKETDRPIIEVSSSIGVQNPQFKMDFVDSENFMSLWDQAMINDGKEAVYGAQGLADLKAGKYANVKWYKEIYSKNTLINNNYMALSGQQKNITYRMSGSYDYQDGTLPNNNYERYIFKPDMSIKILDNLSFRGSLQYTETQINEPQGGTTNSQKQATRIAPISFIKEANGLYSSGSSMGGNPIAGVNEGGYKENLYKEFVTILEMNFAPLKDWNIKGSFANYTSDYWYKDRTSTYYLYDADGNVAKTVNMKSKLEQYTESSRRTTLQMVTDYSKTFNQKHNFKLLAGYSQEYYKIENFKASREDMPFDGIDVLDVGLTNKQNSGNAYDLAIQSVFGRINYDYQSKYLFEANIRADGSSRFAKGHRWGAFPSFSAGWNIKEEDFMSNLTWLSSLKLRGSWGILGDSEKKNGDNLDYYPTAEIITYNPTMYVFNNTLVPGAYNNKAINSSISWEEAALTNIGLDLSAWDQRIRFSADYFNYIRDKILNNPPVSLEFGLPAPITNELKMQNRGVEFLAGYSDRSADFSWGININASTSKTKVLDLGGRDVIIESVNGMTVYTTVGKQYRLPYGYIADGLFQNQAEIDGHAAQLATLYPGNIKYKDLSSHGGSQGKIDGDDRAIISDKVPWRYGFNINFGYKNLDFSANFYGKLNAYRYMSGYEGWAFYLTQNARPMHNDAWTPQNPDASYPRLTIVNSSNDYVFSSYWYRKADYLKLQNLQIGYTFPKSLLEKVNIDYLRLYVTGQNIATFTNYDGFDPEASGDGGYYPIPQTWAFGLNLKF